jgi:DNA-binding NarL/FixJ family response regulator
MKIRVFIVDDQEVVRTGARVMLEANGDIEVVGEASTAAEAVGRIPLVNPDVAVLDVRLPDGDGVEICREIRSLAPDVACLMFTSFADDDAVFAAIMAGASGYVLKDIRGPALLDGIRRVAAGQSLLDPAVTSQVLERVRSAPAADDSLSHLSDQERRVLELITEGRTNKQIGAELHLAEKTVKNYVSSVLAKLGMSRRTEAAVYAATLTARRPGSVP